MLNTLCKLMLLMVLLIGLVNAIPPLNVFKKMQDSSDEHVYIKVISVEVDSSQINTAHFIGVLLNACVDSIVWSKNNLTVKDIITISYQYNINEFPGDTIINGNDTNVIWIHKIGGSSASILDVDDFVPAFCNFNKNDNYFTPSAAGHSFLPHIKKKLSINTSKNLNKRSFNFVKRNGKLILNLLNSSTVSMEMLNIQGKILKRYNLSGGKIHTIPLYDLANQVLFVKINKNYLKKFNLFIPKS